ncbi:MAG: aminotransferase class I/II-fold pyridoxal phosphate-dependent enzyme [Planctomycetales bacterium]|nr:aminotransferase class I/II-fold pyridoxal phosphate-dependent enzyme [Planctomycetales bacterium]
MPKRPEDICPEPTLQSVNADSLLNPGIYPAAVYRCADPDEALALLEGRQPGYVYQRDGHPNADALSAKCARLHQAEWAVVTSSGMSAMASALLAFVQHGDHLVVSDGVYGHSINLLRTEASRMGIDTTLVDTNDVEATIAAVRSNTKMIVAETISNPLLRVANIKALAEIARDTDAKLLIDNTFATPIVCQPLLHGADLVLESISKMMNGHGDVMLGMLAGRSDELARVRRVMSVWGLTSSPFDCWLAARGLATLPLRMQQACISALEIARFLSGHDKIDEVVYPGLPNHPDYQLAVDQFRGQFGCVVTFRLAADADGTADFIRTCQAIPFCPSLGDVSTTLSHPASTSHRSLSEEEQAALGIGPNSIRLSVGTEPANSIVDALDKALSQLSEG